jgi:hypothetical protein
MEELISHTQSTPALFGPLCHSNVCAIKTHGKRLSLFSSCTLGVLWLSPVCGLFTNALLEAYGRCPMNKARAIPRQSRTVR